MKKNPHLDPFGFTNPFIPGTKYFKIVNRNLKDFELIEFRDKAHIEERLEHYCEKGDFGYLDKVFDPGLISFQLLEEKYMIERDVLNCLPDCFQKRIFFKIEEQEKKYSKHISSNKVFYQSVVVNLCWSNHKDYSLFIQVQIRRNCKMNLFYFHSSWRSNIFFLKQFPYCFITNTKFNKLECIILFHLQSRKICYRLFLQSDNRVGLTHTIARVDEYLMVIGSKCSIFFFQDRHPFRVRKVLNFSLRKIGQIRYLPSREEFLFFVFDYSKYNNFRNLLKYRYMFLHEISEEEGDSENTKRIIRRLKKKYIDYPNSKFQNKTKQNRVFIMYNSYCESTIDVLEYVKC